MKPAPSEQPEGVFFCPTKSRHSADPSPGGMVSAFMSGVLFATAPRLRRRLVACVMMRRAPQATESVASSRRS